MVSDESKRNDMGQAKRRGTKEQRIASATPKSSNFSAAGTMLKRPAQEIASFLQREHGRLVDANNRNEKDLSRDIFLDILLPFSVPIDIETGPYARFVENAKGRGISVWWFREGSDLHGVTLFAKGAPHVFVRSDQDDVQTADTLLHELVHTTGPSLGRWTWDNQPQKLGGLPDMGYEQEELIAVTAAAHLIGIANDFPSHVVEACVKASAEEYWQLANLGRFGEAISMKDVAEARIRAVDFLLR
jgi:hypothetical protein